YRKKEKCSFELFGIERGITSERDHLTRKINPFRYIVETLTSDRVSGRRNHFPVQIIQTIQNRRLVLRIIRRFTSGASHRSPICSHWELDDLAEGIVNINF